MTKNVEYLTRHGPAPMRDLPHSTDVHDKEKGLATLKLNQTRGEKSVAYLIDEHDPEDVIRVFVETNDRFRDRYDRGQMIALFATAGREFNHL